MRHRLQPLRYSVRILLLPCLITVGLLFSGCGDDVVGPDPDPQAPVANAGSDQTVTVGDEVTLDGSGSSHPEGDPLTFSWSLDAPEGSEAELADPSAEQTTFTADVEGEYVATLTVTNGDGQSDDDSVTITAEAEDPDEVTELSGTIDEDRTLTSDTRYRVIEGVTVTGSTLTIEAGTIIEFEEDTYLIFRDEAVILADGTEEDPILLTGTEQSRGWWQGVWLRESTSPDNLMNYVTIEYAGSEPFFEHQRDHAANLVLGGTGEDMLASLTLTNSTLRQSALVGMYIYIDSTLPDSHSNTYTENFLGPVGIYARSAHYLDGNSSYTGNDPTRDYIWIGAEEITQDRTWEPLDVPYGLGGHTTVVGAELHIEPGTTFSFQQFSSLRFDEGSNIRAEGTEDDPIVFSGLEQTPGWWQGIWIRNTTHADNIMDHVIIEYAGEDSFVEGDPAANLVVGGSENDLTADMTLTNSILRNGGAGGLWVHAGSTINEDACDVNSFEDNAEQDCEIE